MVPGTSAQHSGGTGHETVYIIVGVVGGVFILWMGVWYWRRRSKRRAQEGGEAAAEGE